MSGKKQAQVQTPWPGCPKCHLSFPTRSYLSKHTENNCSANIAPFFNPKLKHLGLQLSLPPSTPTAPSLKPQRIPTSKLLSNQIHLHEHLIKEASLETLEWITLKPYSNPDDHSDQEQQPNIPIILQVWPIPEQPSNLPNYKGILTPDAFLKHPQLQQNQTYSLEKLSPETTPILLATKIELEIDEKRNDDVSPSRVIKTFKQNFHSKPMAVGNKFCIIYYTGFLNIRIKSIEPNSSPYAQLMEPTEIKLCWNQTSDLVHESAQIIQKPIKALNEIGGLDLEIKEILSTIKYIFKPTSKAISVPKGILLYGHSGTGKSITIHAVCQELNMRKVVINDSKSDFPEVTLKEQFDEALKSFPVAIIVENLDVIGTKVSRNEPLSSFSYQFRSQVERIMKEKCEIVIIATATKVESIDPILRSPQIFGKEIEMPVPGVQQRYEILTKVLDNDEHGLIEEDYMSTARLTHGFVGADLVQLCSEAIQLSEGNLSSTALMNASILVRPSAIKSILVDVPDVKWKDIGGMHELKHKLMQSIKWPIDHPEAFSRFGISPPKGILMFGPPGCSKTMIAKAMATESGLNFLSVKGSELYSKWVGESEKAVQNLFRKARQVAPCILFFDEIDAIGGERGSGTGSSGVHERVLAQLLVEIDGVEQLKDVTIVAATNRPDLIDQALSRPGRLDRLVYVPLPDSKARHEIFNINLAKMPTEENIDVDELVKMTDGYSGAEISAVCQESALQAMERDMETGKVSHSDLVQGTQVVTKRTPVELVQFYKTFCSNFIDQKI